MGRNKNKKRRFLNKYWVGAAALALFEIFASYSSIKQEKNIIQYHKEVFQDTISFLKNKPILRTATAAFYLTSQAPFKLGVFQVPFEDIVKSLENEQTITNIESIIKKERNNKFSEIRGFINFNKENKEMEFYKCMSLNEELMLDLKNQRTTEEKISYLDYLYNLELPNYKVSEKKIEKKPYFLDFLYGANRQYLGDYLRKIKNIDKERKEKHLDNLINYLYYCSENSYIYSEEQLLTAYFDGNFGPDVIDIQINTLNYSQYLGAANVDKVKEILKPSEQDIKNSHDKRQLIISDLGGNHFVIYDLKKGKYDMVEWQDGKILGIEKEFKLLSRVDKNNDYLIKNIDKKEISNIFNNPIKTRENIIKKLSKITHTYRKNKDFRSPHQYTEEANNVSQLTPTQILRVHILMKSLEKQSFVDHIGERIEADLKDPYSEHGGLVLFDSGLLQLYNIESELAKDKNISNNGKYLMPEEAEKIPNIATYHFHAIQENCSGWAGPSQGDGFPITGDLKSAIWAASSFNEANRLLITKLKGQKFNIDYYYCKKTINKESQAPEYSYVVLDLGDYEYKK